MVKIQLGFQADTKQLEGSIRSVTEAISKDLEKIGKRSNINQQMSEAAIKAGAFQKAVERATTASGKISFSTINKELAKAGTSIDKVAVSIAKAGPEMSGSFKSVLQTIVSADKSLISVSARLQEMKRVMTQSVKFTMAQSLQRELASAVRSSIDWVKDLDKALTDIAVVSEKSASEMSKVYDTVLDNSKKLKVAASDYAEAALIFYQQGLPDAEVEKRSEITIKAAKAAGQSTEEMSKQLTAIWNTYKMAGQEQERAAAVGARLAADTAVEFKDLAEAMQSSASAAATMGVSYNALGAMIATVGDTTQQSASIIGNSFKTIFSRFEQLKASGTDGEVTLNTVSANLQKLGINVLDQEGNLKKLQTVIEEVGNGWNNYTEKQKIAIAETVGGTRQYTQFLALMNNFDKYQKLKDTAGAEDGSTLTQQYETALESVTEKQRLAAESWKRAFKSIFEADSMKTFYDSLAKVGNVVENLLDTFGGLKGILLTIASIFSKDLVNSAVGFGRQIKDMFTVTFGENGAQKIAQKQIDNIRKRGNFAEGSSEGYSLNIIEQTVVKQQELNNLIANGNEAEKMVASYQKETLDNLTQSALQHTELLASMEAEVAAQEKLKENPDADGIDKVNEKIAALKAERSEKALDDFLSPSPEAKKRIAEIDAEIKKLETSIQKMSGEDPFINFKGRLLQEIKNNLKGINEAVSPEELKAATKEVRSYLEGLAGDSEEAKQAIAEIFADPSLLQNVESYSGIIESVRDKISELPEELQGQLPELQAMVNAITGLMENVNPQGSPIKPFETDFQALTGAVLGTVTAISQFVNVTVNLIDKIEKGNVSFGDFLAVITSLLPAIMSIGKITKELGGSFSSLGIAFKEGSIGAKIFGKMGFSAGEEAAAGGIAAQIGWAPFIAIILAITAAIAGLVVLFKFLAEEAKNTSAEGRLEQAKTAAEDLKKAEDEAKDSADRLRESFDKYSEAKKNLDRCTVGTEEWRDALVEANNAAKELLNNLPSGMTAEQIKDLVQKDQYGNYSVNKGAYDKVQKVLDDRASSASYASSIGQMKLEEANLNYRLERLKDRSEEFFDDSIASQGVATADGYSLPTITREKIQEFFDNKDILNNLKDTLDNEDFENKLKKLGVSLDGLADDEITELRKGFQELGEASSSLTEKFKIQTEMAINEKLGNDYSAEEKALISKAISGVQEDLYNKYLGALTNGKEGSTEFDHMWDDFEKGDNKINQDFINEYNRLTGKDWSSQSLDSVQGTDTNRSFKFLDENGNEQVRTAKQIAAEMAAAEALQGLADSAAQARKWLAELGETDSKAATQFLNEGNLNNLTTDELVSLGSGERTTELTDAEKAIYGSLDAYNKAVSNAMNAISSATDDNTKSVRVLYKNLKDSGGYTGQQADMASDLIQSAFNKNGMTGGQNIVSLLNNIPIEKMENFEEIIDSINWTNPDMDALQAKLHDLGFTEGEAANYAEILTDALHKQSDATLKTAQASYAAISKIIQGLDDYSVIDQEAINTLADAGVATELFFQQLADGTYMLTKDASEFRKEVEQIALKPFYDIIANNTDSIDTLSKYSGLTDTTLNGIGSSDKLDLMAAMNGGVDTDQIAQLRQDLVDAEDDYEALAAAEDAINQALKESGITVEQIGNTAAEKAQELAEAQKQISEANFQNDVKDFGLDLEETINYAKRLKQLNENLEMTEEAAQRLAIANQRAEKGVKNLSSSFEDYKKIIKESNKGTFEYSKTLDDMKDNLADLLNIGDGDMLSDDFATAALESGKLEKAINGNQEAFDELRRESAIDMGDMIMGNMAQEIEDWKQAIVDGTATTADIIDRNSVKAVSAWETLKEHLENDTLGEMDVSTFESSMNSLIDGAHMTYEQVTSMLGAMGVDASVETNYERKTTTIPTYIENRQILESIPSHKDDNGDIVPATWRTRTWTESGEPWVGEALVPVYSVHVNSGGKDSGGNIKTNNLKAPSGGGGSKGGGGGGSSSKKSGKVSYHKRYANNDRRKSTNERNRDLLQSKIDRTTGPNKSLLADKNGDLLRQRNGILVDRYKEAIDYLATDKTALKDAIDATKLSMTAVYDNNGYLTNSEEIQKKLETYMKQFLDAEGNVIDSKEEQYEQSKKLADAVIEAMEQVDETAEEIETIVSDALENIDDYIKTRVDSIKQHYEQSTKVANRDIDWMSTMVNFFGEFGITSGEANRLVSRKFKDQQVVHGQWNSEQLQMRNFLSNMAANLASPEAFSKAFLQVTGKKISDEQSKAIFEEYWKNGTKVPQEIQDALIELYEDGVSQFENMKDTMGEIFDNFYSMCESFMSQFDSLEKRIEVNNAKIDVIEKLINYSGGDKSIKGLKNLAAAANSRVTSAAAALSIKEARKQTATDTYNSYNEMMAAFLKKNGDKWYEKGSPVLAAEYNKLKEGLDQAREQWQTATSDAANALGEFVDATEAAKEASEAYASAQFAMDLSGLYTSMEDIMEYYGRNKDEVDYYLDNYDKKYNLDKMDYQIADYLKDNNITDPARMKAWTTFQEKVNKLRAEGVKLTQAQIDKLQAEFELEQLMDDYENSKNAKNTMRLARDASGNWSYIYSQDADSESSEDKYQKILDKQKEIRDMGKDMVRDAEEHYMEMVNAEKEYRATIDWELYKIDEDYRKQVDHTLQYFMDQRIKDRDVINRELAETGIAFNETAIGITIGLNNMDQTHNQVTRDFEAYTNRQQEASGRLQKAIEDNCAKEGIDYKNLRDTAGGYLHDIDVANSNTADTAKSMADTISSKITEARTTVMTEVPKMVSEMTKLYNSLLAVKELLDQVDNGSYTGQKYTIGTEEGQRLYKKVLNGEGPQTMTDGWVISKGDDGNVYADKNGSRKIVESVYGIAYNKVKNTGIAETLPNGDVLSLGKDADGSYKVYIFSKGDPKTKKLAEPPMGYATGGLVRYPTIASIAEKGPELVLNAEDTQNILNTVKCMREMVNSEMRSAVYLNDLYNFKAARMAQGYRDTLRDTLQQQVHIDASFPNVSVASEIEEAFNNLVNETVQYIERNK